MATRFLAESFFALAFPPFSPPNLPKTAAALREFTPIDFVSRPCSYVELDQSHR